VGPGLVSCKIPTPTQFKHMKKATGSILDQETKDLMSKLNVKPRICEYCKGEYYPYKTDTKKHWEQRQFCRSICKANDNLKPFKKTLT